jgi:hypothetical protein
MAVDCRPYANYGYLLQTPESTQTKPHTASCPSKPFILGAFGGLGNGLFLTNAATGNDMLGAFENYNMNLGFGAGISITLSVGDGGVWAFTVTGNLPGYGLSMSSYPTNTIGFTNRK